MKLMIKELREEYGMTQTELAKKLNNAQRNVSNWENGTSEPDCETICAIADVFKISIDELFGRNNLEEQHKVQKTIYSLIKHLSPEIIEALKNFLIMFEK